MNGQKGKESQKSFITERRKARNWLSDEDTPVTEAAGDILNPGRLSSHAASVSTSRPEETLGDQSYTPDAVVVSTVESMVLSSQVNGRTGPGHTDLGKNRKWVFDKQAAILLALEFGWENVTADDHWEPTARMACSPHLPFRMYCAVHKRGAWRRRAGGGCFMHCCASGFFYPLVLVFEADLRGRCAAQRSRVTTNTQGPGR